MHGDHICPVHMSDYGSKNLFTWCTNCGNYGINTAVKTALVEEKIAPKDALLCFDIGCNGNGADKIGGYRFHGLHGRVIPAAAGAAMANRRVTVIASAGDGATFGEGVNHLVHAVRSNYPMVFLLHNNNNYALTTGQASPLSPQGAKMNGAPDGVTSTTIHVLNFVFSLQPSFVARGYSGNVRQLTEIIRAGIHHKGFAFIEILQDCPTYNDETPHDWYLQRVYDATADPSYNKTDLAAAQAVAKDLEHNIATGVLYQNEAPDYLTQQPNRASSTTELVDEVRLYSVEKLLSRFR